MALKVALMLSGQPRSYKAGFEYHKKNLLNKFDVDVYMHTWPSVSNEIKGDLVDLYGGSIKTSEIETDERFVTERFTRIPNYQFPAINTFRMFYSLYQSYAMIRTPEIYDVIIRSRYDFALNMFPPLHETRVNTIYVPSDRMTPEHDFCADMFAWGTPQVMKKYSSVYYNLEYLYDRLGTMFIGEDLLSAHLKANDLIGANMAYVDMNNPFPPGEFNGNWHSFLRGDFREWNKDR